MALLSSGRVTCEALRDEVVLVSWIDDAYRLSFHLGCACDCRSERGEEAPRLNVRARSRSIRCGDYAPPRPFVSRQILTRGDSPVVLVNCQFAIRPCLYVLGLPSVFEGRGQLRLTISDIISPGKEKIEC